MKILVTGASSGIGKAMADHLESMHEVVRPGRQELDLSIYPCMALDQFDTLLLCAGSDLGGKQPFVQMQDAHWQNTMQVNLLSNMKLIKDYIGSRNNKWSKLIVIGSTATDHVWPGMLPYSLSKMALEQFCRALRQEVQPGIGITIIRPGLVRTNFNHARYLGQLDKQTADAWYQQQPHLNPSDFIPIIDAICADTQHQLKEITVAP